MNKTKTLYIVAAAMIAITAAVFIIFGRGSADSTNCKFLEKYGWEVEPHAIEEAQVKIPKPLGLVYESYNEMQRAAGLDLEPYAGKNAVRYTYIVTNFPDETESEVRANVLCVDGTPVGGDVMTVDIDGFMEPLSFLSEID